MLNRLSNVSPYMVLSNVPSELKTELVEIALAEVEEGSDGSRMHLRSANSALADGVERGMCLFLREPVRL